MFSKNSSSGRKPEVKVAPSQATATTPAQAAPSPAPTAPTQAPAAPKAALSANNGVPSLISKDLRIVGNLTSSGELQVDGSVEGDIKGTNIVVGNSGKVTGNVVGDHVRIAGKLRGSIDAGKVELDQSARVTGDLRHDDISIASGAQFDGNVMRRGAKTAEPPKPQATAAATGPREEEKPASVPTDKLPGGGEQASTKSV